MATTTPATSTAPNTTTGTTAVLLPLDLSAFALTERICNSTDYKIGPITQHNYSYLRLHQQVLSSDTLDHVDVHSASPSTLNPRVTNLGTGELRQERLGVYVHWTLPQIYRSGYAAANAPPSSDDAAIADNRAQAARKRQAGYPMQQNPDNADFSAPDFRPCPNRWLVIRHLQMDPRSTTIPSGDHVNSFEAWVVESDTITNINSLTDDSVDIENEFAPFVKPSSKNLNGAGLIDEQAEVFIGKKTQLADWESSVADAAPHVDLSILASSNPLFADNTHHNMNVFTIVDNFKYKDNQGHDAYLSKAKADYHVIGWHSRADDDPMTTSLPVAGDTAVPLNGDRLKAIKMELKSITDLSKSAWLNSTDPSRILCHATIYDVEFDRSALPTHLPASDAGSLLKTTVPVAVGNTAMDALLAYCSAHFKKNVEEADWQEMENDLLQIQGLLRQSEDEDVDGLRAAQDENFQQAFNKSEGGYRWTFKQQAAPASQPVVQPTDVELEGLAKLNSIQAAVDNVKREAISLKWALFAWWWKYVSDVDTVSANYRSAFDKLSQQHDTLLGQKGQLATLNTSLQQAMTDLTTIEAGIHNPGVVPDPTNPGSMALLGDTYLQRVVEDGFYQRKDPVLMFGHMGCGWDSDFVATSKVRLQDQTLHPPPTTSSDGWETLPALIKDVLGNGKDGRARIPSELQAGVNALLNEFHALKSSNAITSAIAPSVIPWYHDETGRFHDPVTVKDETRGRDYWQSTQPWRPIFIEWEAIYYDIPFEKWKFKEFDSRWNWGSKVVHYGVNDPLTTEETSLSRRHLSGRQYLLPQASSSLSTILKSIFGNTNSNDLKDLGLPENEQKTLLGIVADLEIISAPMTGLTSHLLTLYEGSHLQPVVRLANQPVTPIGAAVKALPYSDTEITHATDLVTKMSIQTKLTPYGSSDILDGNSNTAADTPMKQVTHGQLTFTKINIVDKFGQVISAIGPAPPAFNQPISSITPCISDSYFPGTIDGVDPNDVTARANTVHAQSDNKACSFLALTPSINQPARLNASFVTQRGGGWKKCTEWDDPIWGWIVINYADNGLQIFLPDGTFYREIRPGGQFRTAATKKFLPFTPPAKLPQADWKIAQLDKLIAKLATKDDESYLQGFFQMINQSLDDKQAHAPASYATYSSAIVGKPLALVNAGWSLELAGSQNVNWSTSITNMPARKLLNEIVDPKDPNGLTFPSFDSDPNGASYTPQDPMRDRTSYTFAVKIGDSERSFDGLVGYWPVSPDNAGQITTPTPATTISNTPPPDLDLTTLYTYFTDGYPATNPPTTNSDPKAKPAPSSDPRTALTSDPDPNTGSILTPLQLTPYHFSSTLIGDHSAKLRIYGLIIDPFFPVHGYSAILPNKSLKLPEWTVEQALKRMTAFWHAGPLLVVADVPLVLTDADQLTSDYVAAIAPPPTANPDPANAAVQQPQVAIPLAAPAASSSGARAEYRWLQPYWKDVSTAATATTTTTTIPVFDTRYRALGISGDAASGADAVTMRLEAAPYTAVEGYIQMTKPLA